jgi:hypothetical protein
LRFAGLARFTGTFAIRFRGRPVGNLLQGQLPGSAVFAHAAGDVQVRIKDGVTGVSLGKPETPFGEGRTGPGLP